MEHYLALFEPDRKAGGYTVTFPDFGYGVTQGESGEEALELAQDLLMLTIGDYIREGKPLPAPARSATTLAWISSKPRSPRSANAYTSKREMRPES